MLQNSQTCGFLAFDLSDRITSNDEAYACTTTSQDAGPTARSVFVITKVKEEGIGAAGTQA
jgi:hypothetical protein